LQSAHDVSEGGLAVALAECLIDSPGLGAQVDVPESNDESRVDERLFGESQSRIVVSCRPTDLQQIQALTDSLGVECRILGQITADNKLDIEGVLKIGVEELKERYYGAIPKAMDTEL